MWSPRRVCSGGDCTRPLLPTEKECCLLLLNSVTSTLQWIRQPKPRDDPRIGTPVSPTAVTYSKGLVDTQSAPHTLRRMPAASVNICFASLFFPITLKARPLFPLDAATSECSLPYTDITQVDIFFVVCLFKYDSNAIPLHYSFTNVFRPCVFG